MTLCLELEEESLTTTIPDQSIFNQKSNEHNQNIDLKGSTQAKMSSRQLPEWLVQKRKIQISQFKKTCAVKKRKISNIRFESLF
jgi:hypothetical protein